MSSVVSAQPIEADKLFKNSKYSMVKISPNGKYISTFVEGDDHDQYIYISYYSAPPLEKA